MNIKMLGRLSVISALSTFCPIFGGFLVLFFGYSVAFYVLGIPLLTVGIVSLGFRTYILIKSKNEFAKITKAIIDAVLMTSLVVLSLVFTTAEIVDTETGYKIVQSGTMLGTIGFVVLYLGTLIVISLTNQKIGRAYLKMKKAEKSDIKAIERQIVDITKLCETVFRNTHTTPVVTERGVSFDICFSYGDYGVKISKEHEIRYGYDYFDIDVRFRKNPIAEPTPFWQLYAYYDDKRYDTNFCKENMEVYLTKLKEYLDNNRFFYAATDTVNKKRYFFLEGTCIELPYVINLETETELRFGEKSNRIIRNRP